LPFANAFARKSIAARTTESGYGSPTPHACDRSSRSCSSSVSSSGICFETNRPKPVLTTVGVLVRTERNPLDDLAGCTHLTLGALRERPSRPLQDRHRPDVLE